MKGNKRPRAKRLAIGVIGKYPPFLIKALAHVIDALQCLQEVPLGPLTPERMAAELALLDAREAIGEYLEGAALLIKREYPSGAALLAKERKGRKK